MWYKHRLGLFQFIKWTLFRQAEVFSSHHTLLRLDKAVDTGSNHRGESGGGGVGRNRWLWRWKIGKSMLTSFFCLFYVSKLWILDLTIEGKVCGGEGGRGGVETGDFEDVKLGSRCWQVFLVYFMFPTRKQSSGSGQAGCILF